MPRRGENIYKRKDGRWEGRYIKSRVDGKTKYGYIFARTYAEAKAKLALAVSQISIEKMEFQEPPMNLKSDAFANVTEEWFENLKPQLKMASIVKYRNIIDHYIFPEFKDKEIEGITKNDVMRFCKTLLTSGGVKGNGLSPKTVMGVISVLKNILKYASQVNNYAVVDINDVNVKQAQKPMRILSRHEQQKLDAYLYENLSLCNLGILVCLYTGIRIGEICALKWEDVSLEEKSIYVHRTMQRIQRKDGEEPRTFVLISTPKSDCSIRKIPLPTRIYDLTLTLKQPANAYFLTGQPYHYIEPRTMYNHFQTVIKQCNIGDTNFHALRHTFATRCVELGFDIKSLSEILGHASVNITLNRYVHPSMELKQKNMNMLSTLFSVK